MDAPNADTADTADTAAAAPAGHLSARAAAAALGVHERTVRRAIERGDLEAVKYAGTFRIAPEAIERLRQRLVVPLPIDRPRRSANQTAPRAAPAPPVRLVSPATLRLPPMPRPPTALLGRDREIATVAALLRAGDCRLVTLTGPGGVGKTRLALALAAELRGDFPDGVAFVPLAAVRDSDLVASTLVQSLGLNETGHRPATEILAAELRDRRLLLVLDNFEQVAAAGPLIAPLLETSRNLTVLVTSREALRLQGERRYPIQPLDVPSDSLSAESALERSAAVTLFVARAREVDPDFALTDANVRAVAEICRRLDGLPLAIELAAARVALLPPAALLARLERRLPILTGGARDLPERQRTMRDAIAWSHDLLASAEQTLFRRLAVFAGGFTLEAAEYVSREMRVESRENNDSSLDSRLTTLDLIAALVDRSLVQRWDDLPGDEGGEPRYGMLETIREFGLDRLTASGEADAVRRGHAEHVLALSKRLGAGLDGPNQGPLLRELEREHDNARAALAWAIEGDALLGLRIARALAWSWRLRGHLTEGRAWLERALKAAGEADLALRADAWHRLGMFASDVGDSALALRNYEESLRLWRQHGDPWGIAVARISLGLETFLRGDYLAARPIFEEALAAFRELRDERKVALSIYWLGRTALEQGDLQGARSLLNESLAIFQSVDYRQRVARVHQYLGMVEEREGDRAAAVARYQQALALFREVEHQFGIADTERAIGWVDLERGAFAEAASHLTEALRIMHEMDSWWGMADALEGCAGLAAAWGGRTSPSTGPARRRRSVRRRGM